MEFRNLIYQQESSLNLNQINSYTKVFAETLIKHAEQDTKIIGITGAMPSGTGLNLFEKRFPDRTFDVGIAEQYVVTFAAGLATEGYKHMLLFIPHFYKELMTK